MTTGSNANGCDLTSITVRMAGYTNHTASSANDTRSQEDAVAIFQFASRYYFATLIATPCTRSTPS
jgi:hypothetical protein